MDRASFERRFGFCVFRACLADFMSPPAAAISAKNSADSTLSVICLYVEASFSASVAKPSAASFLIKALMAVLFFSSNAFCLSYFLPPSLSPSPYDTAANLSILSMFFVAA